MVTKTFRVVAEAYKIIAVSLNSAGSEQGGSEIDFGKAFRKYSDISYLSYLDFMQGLSVWVIMLFSP